MKFARLGESGQEIPVVITAEGTYDLRPVTSDVNGDFLASDPVGRTRAALDAGTLPPSPAPTTCASAPRSPGRAP